MHPAELNVALKQTARTLSNSFNMVFQLNGQKWAPMPERNTVVHLGSAFLSQGFAVYAEPTLPGDTGRLDLVASNNEKSFAIEVKTFGNRDMSAVLNDALRLTQYVPQPEQDVPSILDFWHESERWGLVVVQAFVTTEFRKAWEQLLDPTGLAAALDQVKELKSSGRANFLDVGTFLQAQPEPEVGSIRVSNSRWDGHTPLGLLWAAFKLK